MKKEPASRDRFIKPAIYTRVVANHYLELDLDVLSKTRPREADAKLVF